MLTPAQLQAGAIPFGCLYNARTAALYLLGRIAGVTDPETIAANSAGFNLPISNETAMLFLLAQMAGVTNLDEVISGSAGYGGLNERAAALYLAEVIAAGGSGPSGDCDMVLTGDRTKLGTLNLSNSVDITGAEFPLVEEIVELGISGCTLLENISFPYLRTIAMSQDASGNPALLTVGFGALETAANINLNACPLLASLSFPVLVSTAGAFSFSDCTAIEEVTAPLLEAVNGTGLFGSNNPALISVAFPGLQTVVGNLNFGGCSALPSLTLPSLVTVTGNTHLFNCTILASFFAPAWVVTDGSTLDFTAAALDAASVNHILARCVASGVTTCTIDLSGGTSAAPTGQGITDKADLITAGNTVTTN